MTLQKTLCRVAFGYSDPVAGSIAVHQFLSQQPWSGSRFTRVDQEARRGTSYVAREGFVLPEVDVDTLAY